VRVELARIALDSACALPDVVGSSAGERNRWQTAVGDEWLPGVVCFPLRDGGFNLELHLVTRMVSLPVLAEKVRDRVQRAAARAGLGDDLRRIDVAFEDIDAIIPPLPAEFPP
jgi:hypothetical protein